MGGSSWRSIGPKDNEATGTKKVKEYDDGISCCVLDKAILSDDMMPTECQIKVIGLTDLLICELCASLSPCESRGLSFDAKAIAQKDMVVGSTLCLTDIRAWPTALSALQFIKLIRRGNSAAW